MQNDTAKTESPPLTGTKRKRQQIVAACTNCRIKKSKCDGVRPKCSQCTKRKVECEYDTRDETESRHHALKREIESLRRQNNELKALQRQNLELDAPSRRNGELEALNKRNFELETLFKLLQDVTNERGIEILELLKQKDLSEVLNWFSPIMHSGPSLSPHPTAKALLPPVSSRLEYELTAAHPNAYPSLASSVDGVPLCSRMIESDMDGREFGMVSGDNGYATPPDDAYNYRPSSADQDPPTEPLSASFHPEETTSNGLLTYGPAPAPHYCDSRLYKLNISKWTDVKVSNEFAARLISFYLETDHACLPFFDADLFLRDMLRRKAEFCTPFLVNAVLLHASVSYTANDLRAAGLTPAFRRAVERLWKTERDVDSIATVAAASLLQVTCSQICEDQLASDLGVVSRAMAARLRLVSQERTIHQPPMDYSKDWLRAASHTAWGLFNLSSLWTFYLHDVAPYVPPDFPIPGDPSGTENGSVLPPLPSYMGQTFTSLCKFWKIAYEFIETYYSDLSVPIIARVPLAFVEATYQKLLLWASDHCSSNEGRPRIHHEAIMRIYFHLVIVELIRPFAEGDHIFLHTFSYPESSPKAVLQASVNQLKRFVRDYRLIFGSFFTTMCFQPALMYVANALIADRADPDRDFYLNLCFVEHIRLSLQYPLASVLLEGLLAMAAENKTLSLETAKTILNEAHAKGAPRSLANGAPGGSKFVADHSLALTDHVGARIDVLSEHFRDRLMFHEFIVDESLRSSECVP